MNEPVPFKEYFEGLIQHERELRTLDREAAEKALVIQAKEYERRLEVLNHAHEQAIKVQSETVPREVYERDKKEVQIWRESVIQLLSEERGRREAQAVAQQRMMAYVGTFLAALSIVLRFI